MRSIKKSWEVRLAGYAPCFLGVTPCTILLLLLGVIFFPSLPGDLMESASSEEALSSLLEKVSLIALCACVITHLIWSFHFYWKIESMKSCLRIRGWVVHLLLGAPIQIALISMLGPFGFVLILPEALVTLISVIGLLTSIVSHRQGKPDEVLPESGSS